MKPRRWELSSEVKKATEDQETIQRLCRETCLSPITIQVCLQRGLKTAEEIDSYLHPKLKELTSPDRIKDMDLAVERLALLRSKNKKIRIFGDYDVDGTCGAALLLWIFREFGFEADARQPDRFKDGYGLSSGAVDKAKNSNVDVLISVDCGITSHEAADRAKELGIDLIIVDHHQIDPEKGLPKALAVIDPQREDCESGLKQLCGCGLAFYLAMALRSYGRNHQWFKDSIPNLKKHLDLVVLATAADMVPLIGDNRILVWHGMQVLKATEKPGFQALMEVSGLSGRSVSPGHLGFVLGPRINASGRIKNASLALNLLTTKNPLEGAELAREIDRLNEERKTIQNDIWDEVKAVVEEKISEGQFKNAIVVGSENWHEGVIGIVASRVTEYFRKPAIVISISDVRGKGSARSYGGKNVLEAMRLSSDHLLGFGGHRHAAGLSLSKGNLDSFAQAFDQAVYDLKDPTKEEDPALILDGVVGLGELNYEALMQLEQLGPFGIGNPEPLFQIEAQIRNQRILKGRHLKLNLSPVGQSGPPMDAIWFHAAEDEALLDEIQNDPISDWVGVPELNRFRGRVTPSFRIRDRHSK